MGLDPEKLKDFLELPKCVSHWCPNSKPQALRSMLYDPWQKELAALLARTKRERDMYQNKGKRGVSAVANSVAVSVPLLQVSLTLHMLNDTIGNKALSCVSRTKNGRREHDNSS